MELRTLLNTIVGWLRAGYPQGVPETDYLPLVALLTRRLSDDEVREVTAGLIAEGILPIDQTDIGVMITKITDELPLDSDVERVLAHLRAGGGPGNGEDLPR